MKVGRNAPCPCGSGKKYKKCCLAKADPPVDLLWYRLRDAHDRLMEKLSAFAQTSLGDSVISLAAAEFLFCPDDEALDELIDDHLPYFIPWFLFSWVYDPDATKVVLGLPAYLTVAEIYLSENQHRLDDLQVRLIEAAVEKPFSFLEVKACEPGRGFTLRDMFTGIENRVLEKTGSEMVQVGDLLLGRVVTVDHVSILMGCSSISIRPLWKPAIIELRMQIKKVFFPISDEIVEDHDEEIRDLYLYFFQAAMQAPPMVNTDGDEIENGFIQPPDQHGLMASPEVRNHLVRMIDGQWKGWVKEKIPVLGGKTPRQAVKTVDGRESVEALLLDARRDMVQDGVLELFDQDPIEQVRRQLGLDRPLPSKARRPVQKGDGKAFKKIKLMIESFGQRNALEPIAVLAVKLCRRLETGDEFSLDRGRPEIWAGAILYVIAQINFLFDPDSSDYIRPQDLCSDLDTNQRTVSSKALLIRRTCDIGFAEPEYMVPEILDMFSFVETKEGFIMPASMVDDFPDAGPFRRIMPDDLADDSASERPKPIRKSGDKLKKEKRVPKDDHLSDGPE